MIRTMNKVGDYFEMMESRSKSRGVFKIIYVHLLGKTITYRPVRWYERLWLWMSRYQPKKKLLRYS